MSCVSPDGPPTGRKPGRLLAGLFARLQLPLTEEEAAACICETVRQELGVSCRILRVEPGCARQIAATEPAAESEAVEDWVRVARRHPAATEPLVLDAGLARGQLGIVVPGWLQERWLVVLAGVDPSVAEDAPGLPAELGWVARTALGAAAMLVRGVQARRSADAASHRVIAVSRLVELLPSTLDLEGTISAVLDAVVPYVGDWGVLFLAGSGGRLERAGVRHLAAEGEAALVELGSFPLPPDPEEHARWLAAPEPFSLGDDGAWLVAPAERRAVDDHVAPLSGIAAPLRRGASPVGLLVVGTTAGGQVYGSDEVRLLRELAKLARVAIESAQLYAAAERTRKQREEVVAIVSHDLRNPLQTIRFAAFNLGMEGLDAARRSTQAALVERSVGRMEHLLQDLLDVSRIEAGLFAVEPRAYSAVRLLEEVRASFSTRAEEEGIDLEVLPTPPYEVAVDRDAIQRVLGNVLANALSFTPRGGRVVLAAEGEEQSVWFRVSDTGPGIPPEVLPHVFDRYWQANRAARTGAGLGLAIAKGIVEAHGGEILARTRPEGGAEFRFRLPRVAGEGASWIPDRVQGRVEEG